MVGKRFGKLVVIKQAEDYILPSGIHEAQWLCRCDCGNKVVVRRAYLQNGHTTTCGCFWKNIYDLSGEYGIGYTNKGEEFYFDLEDYDKIKNFTWHLNNHGYVFCAKNEILMHRLVMNCPDDLIVDHIHGENSITDNRKSNLRIASMSQNSMNTKLRSDNSSGHKGITWDKRSNKWCVRIMIEGKNKYLGYFNKEDLDKAIQTRLDGERKYFGEYSYIHSQKIPID